MRRAALAVLLAAAAALPAAGGAAGGNATGAGPHHGPLPDAGAPGGAWAGWHGAGPAAPPGPPGQEELGVRAAGLLAAIGAEEDPAARELMQGELDAMTMQLLRAGIVVRELYERDREAWGALVDASSRACWLQAEVGPPAYYDCHAGRWSYHDCRLGLRLCASLWEHADAGYGELVSYLGVTLPPISGAGRG